MRPFQPAFWMALSMASNLSHPCSGMTSGRYVAEKDCFDVNLGRYDEEESGEGVVDEEVGSNEGCLKLI